MEKKSKLTVPVNAAAAVEAVADMEEDVEAEVMAAVDMAAAVEDMAAAVEDMAAAVVAVEDIVADVVEVDSAEDEVVAEDVVVVITAIKMATLPENAPNKDRSATRSILSIIHGRGVPPTKATPTF